MKLKVFIIAACVLTALGCWYFKQNDLAPNQPETAQNPNAEIGRIPLGNPSGATADLSNPNNYLLVNPYFALSYNRSRGTPNWVAWRLKKEDMGEIERQNDFRPDERLPQNWRITPRDFGKRGYSRGHLCPSADRTSSIEANSATFLMSNMLPQTNDLNEGPWEKLESYCRRLARRGRTLYIFAGGYGEIGVIRNKVSIPTNNWKIIVILRGDDDLRNIDEKTNIIAVDMPNIEGIKEERWQNYKTTVRQIEEKTGFNFLSDLPQNLQDVLETRLDNF